MFLRWCISRRNAINILTRGPSCCQNAQQSSLSLSHSRSQSINNLAAMHCHVLIILFKHKEIVLAFYESRRHCMLHASLTLPLCRFINYRFLSLGSVKCHLFNPVGIVIHWILCTSHFGEEQMWRNSAN